MNFLKRQKRIWSLMYKQRIGCFLLVICFLPCFTRSAQAAESKKSWDYVLIYDRLYPYAESSSDVLQQYLRLKAGRYEVLMVQAEQADEVQIDAHSKIIIFASSFESKDRYYQTLNAFNKAQILSNKSITSEEEKNGLIFALDEVYPFSDFNDLMEQAEIFHHRGMGFIVTIMPVYENYELESFGTFIKVLKYVHKMGGTLFIHYPIVNTDVKYDSDPRVGLKRALDEYRERGLDIVGITVSEEELFTDTQVFEGLNLPFILTTEKGNKIDPSLDLQKASQTLNKYVYMKGINLHDFDLFRYIDKKQYSNGQAIYFTLGDKDENLMNLLNTVRTQEIPTIDFKTSDYHDQLQKFDYTKVENENNKELETDSEYQEFLNEELQKIRGENLEEEQAVEGYDISWFAKLGIKIALILFVLLIVQVLVGRRFDLRKFFKK